MDHLLSSAPSCPIFLLSLEYRGTGAYQRVEQSRDIVNVWADRIRIQNYIKGPELIKRSKDRCKVLQEF